LRICGRRSWWTPRAELIACRVVCGVAQRQSHRAGAGRGSRYEISATRCAGAQPHLQAFTPSPPRFVTGRSRWCGRQPRSISRSQGTRLAYRSYRAALGVSPLKLEGLVVFAGTTQVGTLLREVLPGGTVRTLTARWSHSMPFDPAWQIASFLREKRVLIAALTAYRVAASDLMWAMRANISRARSTLPNFR